RIAMTDYRLWPLEEGYSDEYDPRTDPTTSLEFATAAFRYGHSTVDGIIKLFHQGFGFEHVFQPEIVFNPSRLRNPEFSDQFFVAMTHQPMQRADNFVSQTMTNYLFNGDRPFGIDLIAINIQRGIDHGLPTYDDMRVLQGLPHAHSFEDFEDRIPPEGIHLLQQIYASPQDVDFYVGGLLERPAYDSVVGPSFQGVIADQFSRLKKGDRFYYEFGNLPNSFTPAQLQELRKTRFARILCDFRDGVALHHVSPHPFLLPSVPGNEPIDCNSLPLPQIDLWTWKEM
ncbi:Chorion peroxidase, partial [Gryllus bimaculatus]